MPPTAPGELIDGGTPATPTEAAELIDGGTPATPGAAGRLIADLFRAGTGAVLRGTLTPDLGDLVLLETEPLNGYPSWSSDGYLGSIADPPRYLLRRSETSRWEVLSQSPDEVLWSYYDALDEHPTPFTVPEWTEENGSGELTVEAEGIPAAGELIDGGTPATPSAPGELI